MSLKYRKSLVINRRKHGAFRIVRASRASREEIIRKRTKRIKLLALVVLIALLLGVAAYILFFSPIFQIKNVEIVKINDGRLLSETELKNVVYSLTGEKYLSIFPRANLFFFDEGSLAEALTKEPRIEFFKIKRKWPSAIEVEVEESRPAATLSISGDDRSYYLNSDGQIISVVGEFENPVDARDFTTPSTGGGKQNADERKSILPEFYDQTSISVTDSTYVALLKDVLTFVKSDVLVQYGVSVNSVKISEEAGIFKVEITVSEGWQILVDSKTDFDKQLSSLGLILAEKIKNEDRGKLDYINLRFGEKIFYKLND